MAKKRVRRRRRGRRRRLLRAHRGRIATLLLVGTTAGLVLYFQSRPPTVDQSIDAWAAHYGVSRRLAHAVAWTESGKNPRARSSADAYGVMQVQPATWQHTEHLLGRDVPHTTDGNIRIGIAYLRQMLRQYGDERLALIAYNQGPTALRRYGVYPSAAHYAATVLALARRPELAGRSS
jgi:soluble lytic murein transglycosylase-like protein